MQTVVEIPDDLYRKAQLKARQSGVTLKDLLVASLEVTLANPPASSPAPAASWARRQVLPEFARLQAAGTFTPKPGDRSIDAILADIKAEPCS